jgi:hypothetical protein
LGRLKLDKRSGFAWTLPKLVGLISVDTRLRPIFKVEKFYHHHHHLSLHHGP